MHPDNPIVFVMVGIPGSGKTTSRAILNAKYFVSSDWHIERLAKQQGKSYNEVFDEVAGEAQSEMLKDVDFMIRMNASFIWDQTNLTRKKRKYILGKIPVHYNKVAVFIDVSVNTAIGRNNSRSRTIPEEIIIKMFHSLEPPSIAEGFDGIVTIDEAGNIIGYEEGKN